MNGSSEARRNESRLLGRVPLVFLTANISIFALCLAAGGLAVVNLVDLSPSGAVGVAVIATTLFIIYTYFWLDRTLRPVRRDFDLLWRLTQDCSHELATPLSTMKSRVQLIERISDDNHVQEHVHVLTRSIARMGNLIGTLRVLSRSTVSGARPELSIVNVQELVDAAFEEMLSSAEAKNIALHNEAEPVVIICDRNAVLIALVNLLTNAIRYGKNGGTVIVRLSHDRRNVEIRVIDDGQGIPESDLPHVFDRFYRVPNSLSTNTGGSGLGLAIVKSIVEAHGGSVRVSSAVGNGSTFCMKFLRSPRRHPILQILDSKLHD